MKDTNKSLDSKKLTEMVHALTHNPVIITNYNSTYPKPHTPKTKITPQEKTRE